MRPDLQQKDETQFLAGPAPRRKRKKSFWNSKRFEWFLLGVLCGVVLNGAYRKYRIDSLLERTTGQERPIFSTAPAPTTVRGA